MDVATPDFVTPRTLRHPPGGAPRPYPLEIAGFFAKIKKVILSLAQSCSASRIRLPRRGANRSSRSPGARHPSLPLRVSALSTMLRQGFFREAGSTLPLPAADLLRDFRRSSRSPQGSGVKKKRKGDDEKRLTETGRRPKVSAPTTKRKRKLPPFVRVSRELSRSQDQTSRLGP